MKRTKKAGKRATKQAGKPAKRRMLLLDQLWDHEYTSLDEALRLTRMTIPMLRREVARRAAATSSSQEKCPPACDGGCDITNHVTPISEYPTPFHSTAPKVPGTYHEWITDSLPSLDGQPSNASGSSGELGRERAVELLAPRYTARAFLQSREEQIGWWWRVPLSWWQRFVKWFDGWDYPTDGEGRCR
jgi:hypothetical protein